MESNSSYHNNESPLPRLLSDSTINKISETLGVLNHVGHFLVDMTRGGPYEPSSTTPPTPSITPPSTNFETTTTPSAVSLQNITEFTVKRADSSALFFHENPKKKKKHNKNKTTKLESITTTDVIKSVPTSSTTSSPQPITESFTSDQDELSSKESENRCKTPDGKNGRCEDLSSCPVLLLNLNGLRESLCFKSLFVPGVCCPLEQNILTTKRPFENPSTSTQSSNLMLIPQIKTTTTKKPPLLINKPSNNSSNKIDIEECGQQEYSAGRIVGV